MTKKKKSVILEKSEAFLSWSAAKKAGDYLYEGRMCVKHNIKTRITKTGVCRDCLRDKQQVYEVKRRAATEQALKAKAENTIFFNGLTRLPLHAVMGTPDSPKVNYGGEHTFPDKAPYNYSHRGSVSSAGYVRTEDRSIW